LPRIGRVAHKHGLVADPPENHDGIGVRTSRAGAQRLPAPLLEDLGRPPPGPHASEHARGLLLVEHDHLFGEGLAILLEWRTGLGCVLAESLAEARAALEGAPPKPECVVVDLDLPEGQGTEVLKELDGVPALALIGSRNVRRQAEAMGLGAEEVLRTTEAAEGLAAAIERLIGGR
jgi:ActR/RegA family two-component response regulator